MNGFGALTFETKGFDVQGPLDALLVAARQAAASAALQKAQAIAETARQLAPCRTGALRDSIGTEYVETENGAEARVFASAPHAAAVELGLAGRPPQAFLHPALLVNL